MTTIVYRDGVMAADTRAYSGESTPIGFKSKISRLKDGSLLAVSSTGPGVGEAFKGWVEEGSDPEAIPDGMGVNLVALHVLKNGDVMYYYDNIFPSGPIHAPWYAVGSGDRYAIGALHCGATADAAVMVAAEHDAWTGGQIQIMHLNEDELKTESEGRDPHEDQKDQPSKVLAEENPSEP